MYKANFNSVYESQFNHCTKIRPVQKCVHKICVLVYQNKATTARLVAVTAEHSSPFQHFYSAIILKCSKRSKHVFLLIHNILCSFRFALHFFIFGVF